MVLQYLKLNFFTSVSIIMSKKYHNLTMYCNIAQVYKKHVSQKFAGLLVNSEITYSILMICFIAIYV